MEPAEAVALAETALREAVQSVLPTWSTAAGAPARENLEAKRQEDAKRRDGALPTEGLLAYTDLHHLISIIEKNWEPFKPVFDDLARTKVFLGLLADYRNPIAHNRELVGFERELVSGASGQLRQQVVLYRTRNEPSSAHYPVIEKVTDNYGQTLGRSLYPPLVVVGPAVPLLRLNVGDPLQFTCVGWDSQERPLTWNFRAGKKSLSIRPSVTLKGRRVAFTVTVGEEWVGEEITVGISLKSPGPHHRNMGESDYDRRNTYCDYDDEVYNFYAVNPPRR